MMSKLRTCLGPFLLCAAASALLPLRASAGADGGKPTLALSSPLERQVFQRGADDVGRVVVAGPLPAGAEVVEARAIVAEGAPRGKAVDWTVVADVQAMRSAGAGRFRGALALSAGGWYRLEVRARTGSRVVARSAAKKIGVGDVFVTAGQSNSANFGQVRQTAKDERVVYFDGKSYVPAQDPIPGGFGGGGTPWPILGDLLAKQWNVPICFRSSTLTFTPVSLWLPGARHNQYRTLVERVKQFGAHGVRAVLWHQGESDSLAKTSAEQYRARLTQVIQSMRKEIGYDVDWFVAQASFHPGSTKQQEKPVAEGQKRIGASKVAFPGPTTDDLLGKEYRHDGVHFTEKGLQVHAQRWRMSITRQYRK